MNQGYIRHFTCLLICVPIPRLEFFAGRRKSSNSNCLFLLWGNHLIQIVFFYFFFFQYVTSLVILCLYWFLHLNSRSAFIYLRTEKVLNKKNTLKMMEHVRKKWQSTTRLQLPPPKQTWHELLFLVWCLSYVYGSIMWYCIQNVPCKL